jgi:hypothetical protein
LAGRFSYEIIPVKINSNYQPELMSEKDGAEFLKRLGYLSNAIAENDRKYNYRQYYVEQLDHFTREERSLSHKYWLSNIWRYPVFFLVQYVFEVLMRRIGRFRRVKVEEKAQ